MNRKRNKSGIKLRERLWMIYFRKVSGGFCRKTSYQKIRIPTARCFTINMLVTVNLIISLKNILQDHFVHKFKRADAEPIQGCSPKRGMKPPLN